MTDDRWISQISTPGQILFVIGEVKTSTCTINGPWTNRSQRTMEKVIQRIGFLPGEIASSIAESLYNQMYWRNDQFVVQYVVLGESPNRELASRHHKLRQILWADVAAFMFERFNAFGYIKGVPSQWPLFGRLFANAMREGRIHSVQDAYVFIKSHIENGPTRQKPEQKERLPDLESDQGGLDVE
jgi:hypothetical protein